MVGVLVLAVLAGAVALWPRGRLAEPAGGGQADPTRLVPATLTSVQTVPCQEAEPGLPGSTCIKVRARPDGGEEVEFETTDPTGDTFRSGQRVRLSILEQAGQPTFYNIRDLERGRPMLALTALFVLAVIAFGRWQGVRSLIGLACSFAVIVGFVVPAILRGRSPVPVALVGAMAIMLASLYLAHGVGRKTTAAVVGTALALAPDRRPHRRLRRAGGADGPGQRGRAQRQLPGRGHLAPGAAAGRHHPGRAGRARRRHRVPGLAGVRAAAGRPGGRVRRADPGRPGRRPGPRRGQREHPVPGLRWGLAAPAGAVRQRRRRAGDGGHRRGRGRRGRPDPVRLDRPDRGRAPDHAAGRQPGARGAGGGRRSPDGSGTGRPGPLLAGQGP